jgi:predicted small secreted protein
LLPFSLRRRAAGPSIGGGSCAGPGQVHRQQPLQDAPLLKFASALKARPVRRKFHITGCDRWQTGTMQAHGRALEVAARNPSRDERNRRLSSTGFAPVAREPMRTGLTDGGAAATDGTDKQEVMVMNKLIALILLVAIGGLSACNTMEGAGKDIQSGGHAVSDTAKDVKNKM